MKVLNTRQIRDLDAFTLANHAITSAELMERAGAGCAEWILEHFSSSHSATIFCGPGNNGGDGLVIARYLTIAGWAVSVIHLLDGRNSPDFELQIEQIKRLKTIEVNPISEGEELPGIGSADIVIDALFGSGLTRPLTGPFEQWVVEMNRLTNPVVSVDIPSGLPADGPRQGQAVEADFTLSMEVPKLAFFIPENQQYLGEWVTIPIGLDRKYLAQVETPWTVLNANDITPLLHQRHKFDHKGTYGHMLVIGGSFGKAGAAILCSQAALRSGAGLVTAHVPGRLVPILQTVIPEVMVDSDEDQFHFTGVDDATSFDAVAIGCGLGTDESTMEGFRDFLARVKYPPVIDADALNLLAAHRELLSSVPHFSILTPHLKEFERIFGPSANHFERLSLLQKSAQRCQVYIVLKGAHTAIATPEGNVYFNTTGNPGMATGGSGDVLTGIIASLLAQGYGPGDAAKTGVYLHGLAGDIAAEKTGYESLIASDIIANIGEAFVELHAETDFPSEISAIQSPYET